ncbi:MAG: TIGR00282 family metallophosphoesterase [Rhodospirillaceae bacterium]|nr:TIGR00282 family metallophosphoesterase [Rhodospirillaceae bacterium]
MKLLFLGDIVGKSGREAVLQGLPMLRERLDVDCVVVNGENAAHGFGITHPMAQDLFRAGVDCLTTGNHVWDKREIIAHIDDERRLLRPINFPAGTPGRGATIVEDRSGHRVLVINAMGRLFMDALDDPFAAVDRAIADAEMPRDVDAIVVDFHAEATSEKMAMGHYLDGRVSLVVGTHSHVPTADVMILTGGTAYQTDAGMCGDYDSVIGMKKTAPIHRFTTKMPSDRLEPAEGPATLCGLLVDIDAATGLARSAAPLRFGGRLSPAWPAVT